ncbi:MFS transporter [Williamsia sterculiae]|uniref:Predicted arabinose efflux permease, MFS family n=1 Tax=Williamsia sterculiae TaxID=1344003 RepID=A0A1N7EZI2_9NOCA|nr:Predicted arabinose efflux permease, MFS family [Williamsia sterculiae]
MSSIRIGRATAFWVVAGLTTFVLFASAAPSPIYPIYQQLWGFSSFTLTVVFAVYVVALLGSLLTVGSLSDHIGRRPVMALALVGLIVAMIVFITADGVGLLVAARVLQGLATGAILGTLSAATFDLQPDDHTGAMANGAAPGLGLSLGVLIAGVLVQYAPAPRFLIYGICIAVFAVLLIAVVLIPETSARVGFESRRHLLTTISPRASVPGSVRGVFLAGVPAMIATWSLGGLQLSLGSSIVGRILGVQNHAAAGAMLFTFFASAAVSAVVFGRTPATTKLVIGFTGLLVGVSLSLVGVITASIPVYLVGAAVAGIGFGTAFVGVMATIGAATEPTQRGQVFASVFLVSYTGFSVPAVVAGLATEQFGLRTTAIGYASFVIALVVIASAAAVWVNRRARRIAAVPAPVVEPVGAMAVDGELARCRG